MINKRLDEMEHRQTAPKISPANDAKRIPQVYIRRDKQIIGREFISKHVIR